MSDQTLIKESAEIVMGVHKSYIRTHTQDKEVTYVNDTNGLHITDKYRSEHLWNPLTNASHTKMLKDKAVEMGLSVSVKTERFMTVVRNGGEIIAMKCGKTVKDELRTTTEAIIEAVKKIKEVQK